MPFTAGRGKVYFFGVVPPPLLDLNTECGLTEVKGCVSLGIHAFLVC